MDRFVRVQCSMFWSRCCCCCCLLLLLPTTSVLKRREVPPVSSFSVSATTTTVSFASILLLLLLLRRDKHFYFLFEVLLLLIIFLVVCADTAAGACAAYNITAEAERGTGYCFFLLRFCPLHCDTFPRLPCPRTKRHVMLNLTSTGVCNTGTSALYVCNLLL